MTGAERGDVSDALLLERLDWVHDWTQHVREQDADPDCKAMASACTNLQADMASNAMKAMEANMQAALEPERPPLPNLQSPIALVQSMQTSVRIL